MDDDETYEKWVSWLEVIRNEITSLSLNRHVFWQVQDMVSNNPALQKPSLFKNVFANMYVESTVMGLRRQLKSDKDSISFKRLLDQIINMPHVLSRDRYVGLYDGHGQYLTKLAHEYFDKYAGKGGKHIDPKLIAADLVILKELTEDCEAYADKRVAHMDKRDLERIPTFGEFNKALDFLEELIKKYWAIVTAVSLTSILPTPQYDWKAIFRTAWLSE